MMLGGYGFHSCRHFFVTWCRNHGTPPSVIESIVGRSFRIYTHSSLEANGKAIDALPRFGSQVDAEVDPNSGMRGLSTDDLQAQLAVIQAELERRRVSG
jgi:hypothetical protein